MFYCTIGRIAYTTESHSHIKYTSFSGKTHVYHQAFCKERIFKAGKLNNIMTYNVMCGMTMVWTGMLKKVLK